MSHEAEWGDASVYRSMDKMHELNFKWGCPVKLFVNDVDGSHHFDGGMHLLTRSHSIRNEAFVCGDEF